VNAELVNLYWQVGQYISIKLSESVWGDKTVEELAKYIEKKEPQLTGFSKRGIYRMRQFYETYKNSDIIGPVARNIPKEKSGIVSPVVTQKKGIKKSIVSPVARQLIIADIKETDLTKISWSNHLIILSGTKSLIEKEFYIQLSAKEKYTKRELQRQIASGLFERVALSNTKKLSPIKPLQEGFSATFKDNYVFEFLNLPDLHNENDLQKAILQNLKRFLLEFSRDFAFIGEEFPIQVGNKDFSLDLLFFNRALNCLVAIELKVVDFVPEHLGKINFCLEALDRDIKKPHENPSIGILLCKAKDDEVVEYSMSRQMNPAMVAQYQLHLPDKKLLQQKLSEFFEQHLGKTAEAE
jgi:predicted nuclease of restriction endonuclease-like (RecB) superfamily